MGSSEHQSIQSDSTSSLAAVTTEVGCFSFRSGFGLEMGLDRRYFPSLNWAHLPHHSPGLTRAQACSPRNCRTHLLQEDILAEREELSSDPLDGFAIRLEWDTWHSPSDRLVRRRGTIPKQIVIDWNLACITVNSESSNSILSHWQQMALCSATRAL